jgi:hypothetical protein
VSVPLYVLEHAEHLHRERKAPPLSCTFDCSSMRSRSLRTCSECRATATPSCGPFARILSGSSEALRCLDGGGGAGGVVMKRNCIFKRPVNFKFYKGESPSRSLVPPFGAAEAAWPLRFANSFGHLYFHHRIKINRVEKAEANTSTSVYSNFFLNLFLKTHQPHIRPHP